MKKEFTRNDLAAIKRAAASIAPFIAKRNKLFSKIEAIKKDLDTIQLRIDLFNIPIKEMTGYNTEDLVERVDGVYVFKYPDTIIPEEQINLSTDNNIDGEAKVDEVETIPSEAPIKLNY